MADPPFLATPTPTNAEASSSPDPTTPPSISPADPVVPKPIMTITDPLSTDPVVSFLDPVVSPSSTTISPLARSPNLLEPGAIDDFQAPKASPEKSKGPDFPDRNLSMEAPKTSNSASPPSLSLLGAWASPLKLPPPTTPAISSSLQDVDISFPESHWPSLSAAASNHRPSKEAMPKPVSSSANHEDPNRIIDDKNRFPWAAKMNPHTRNLYRATTPVYLEDGTPKITIPHHIFQEGIENQKEYLLGQFYRCSAPPGGLIHAVVNRLWGRKCRIFTRKLSDTSYLFHIPDESTRTWVLQRGLWHVDDCLLFTAQWTPTASLELPEISTIPVWVTLKNLPASLYSIKALSWVTSGLGEPMLSYKPRLDPTQIGEAKVMVEVELNKPFPQKIAAEDKKGNISMVDVEYSWIPSKCKGCGQLGHKQSRCLLPSHQSQNAACASKTTPNVASSSPIVSAPMSDCVHANVSSSEDILKGTFVAATDSVLASPDTGFVAAQAAETEVTLEAVPEVVFIEAVPSEAQTASALEVPTIFTKDSTTTTNEATFASSTENITNDTQFTQLAVTSEAAPSANETATLTKGVSTSHYVSSSSETDNHGDSPRASDFVYSSCEDTMDIHQLVEETLQRKSIRNIKPTLKAKELARSANKGRRGKGRRGRSHR